MRNTRRPRLRPAAALCALLAVALTAGFLPGAAQADRLADARAEADKAQVELQSLNDQVAAAAEKYNAAQLQLDETNAKISENKKLLDASKTNLRVSRQELSQMLVDAYRQGNPDLVAMLLNAGSIDQLVDQQRFVQRATSHAEQVVTDVRTYAHDVKQREDALESERATREDALAQRQAEKASIQDALNQRQRLLNSLSSEIQGILARRLAAQRAADAQAAAAAGGILADAQAAATNQDLTLGGSVADGGSADVGTYIQPPPSSSTGGAAASIALGQLGTPYVWGGGAPGGFDCSGLVAWAYGQAGISLPHYAAAQYAMGTPVPMDALEPGDLISFHGSGHIGIYIGGGQYVHAPQTGDVVKVSSLADRSDMDGAVRIG
ncbi:MAG: NlpC/P60 family protein [Thermoleophilia bacterium]